jgi:hypothetical protein
MEHSTVVEAGTFCFNNKKTGIVFWKISQCFCNDTLQLWFMAPYEYSKEKGSPVITVPKMSLRKAQTLNLRAC